MAGTVAMPKRLNSRGFGHSEGGNPSVPNRRLGSHPWRAAPSAASSATSRSHSRSTPLAVSPQAGEKLNERPRPPALGSKRREPPRPHCR